MEQLRALLGAGNVRKLSLAAGFCLKCISGRRKARSFPKKQYWKTHWICLSAGMVNVLIVRASRALHETFNMKINQEISYLNYEVL